MFEAEEIGEKVMLEKASTISEIRGFSGDFRWASNFFPIEPFEYDGVMYFTTENYYQAMKTKDKAERVLIAAMTPNKSKRYASSHNLKFVVREDWDYIKLEVMEFALRRKFSQPKFKELLLATRDIFIEETNSWGDVFWGALPSGEGFNNLGLIMMKLRQELRDGKDLLDYKPEIAKLLKKKSKSQP